MVSEKRLIDANALLEKFQFRIEPYGVQGAIIKDCVDKAREIIMAAPTVDAVEVVHGRWFAHHSHSYECTCCHAKYITMRAKDWNYCPNCGAKMDKNENP